LYLKLKAEPDGAQLSGLRFARVVGRIRRKRRHPAMNESTSTDQDDESEALFRSPYVHCFSYVPVPVNV
jgi:hypothetical protein